MHRYIDVVRTLCAIFDRLSPREDGVSYAEQIISIADRPEHDKRYASTRRGSRVTRLAAGRNV